jgi:S1-C subfamily serine protease
MGLVSSRGLGSGIIVSADGSVLTAAHVVQAADRVGVELGDGRRFLARIVASSPRGDVALLKMENPPPDLVPAPLGNSDSLMTGDEVVVIGAPYGLGSSLSVGHVGGRLKPRQSVGGVPLEFIQTDAHISRGNSGGPMFNLRGEVVGIVSWMLSESGGYEGLGFAVSVNVAKRLCPPPVLSGPASKAFS